MTNRKKALAQLTRARQMMVEMEKLLIKYADVTAEMGADNPLEGLRALIREASEVEQKLRDDPSRG